jgi:hypothetical protein
MNKRINIVSAIIGIVVALVLVSAANAATATVAPGYVNIQYTGTDAAHILYSDGISLAPNVVKCTRVGGRNICRTTYPVTGNSFNCTSSSYFFSGSTPLSTAPLEFGTLLRSSVPCQFSLTIRTVGSGTVTIDGTTYTV